MLQVTLDLLDADLAGNVARYIAYPELDRIQLFTRRFVCDPVLWDRYHPLIAVHGLNWVEFRYAAVRVPQDLPTIITSEEPGIYVFYARPQDTFNFLPRFPFYVGVSNERGTNRPLRERLEEYYNIGEIRKRLNVHQMLQMYYQNVWVAYAHINLNGPQMRELEQQLHGFLYPTFGIRDHTVEVKNTSKAFRL